MTLSLFELGAPFKRRNVYDKICNVLSGDFVHDDIPAIVKNPDVLGYSGNIGHGYLIGGKWGLSPSLPNKF